MNFDPFSLHLLFHLKKYSYNICAYMLLSIMSFVKVVSGKAPALCGYNFGGMGVEFRQCPYDGDKVVL